MTIIINTPAYMDFFFFCLRTLRPAGAVELLDIRPNVDRDPDPDPGFAVLRRERKERAATLRRDRAVGAADDLRVDDRREDPVASDGSSRIGSRTSRRSCARLPRPFRFTPGFKMWRGTARLIVALKSADAEAGTWST